MKKLILKKMSIGDDRMNEIVSEPQSIIESTVIQSHDVQLTEVEASASMMGCPSVYKC